MKKLLICLSVLAIVACKQESKIDYVLLSGKTENATVKKALVKGIDFKQDIEIGTDGTFSDTLKISKNGLYNITFGRERASLYLTQGEDVVINNGKEGFSFEGPSAAINNYFIAKVENTAALRGEASAFYALEEADFKAKINALTAVNKESLNKVDNKAFVTSELRSLEYDSYALLNSYEKAHAHYAKKPGFKISDSFLPEALKNITYDNAEDFNNSASYQQLAFGSVLTPIFEGMDDINNLKPSDLKTVSTIKIPALKNQVVDYLAKMALSPGNTNIDALSTFLIENTTDAKIKESIKVNYDKSKMLAVGQPSPTFVDYENHKGGTTSLEDLKGKYVYVDVWATWCGPCKAEIPSLKKVEKKYHGKNIAFVSTSVDTANAHEKWVNMVKNEELGGIQLLADKSWQSKFVQDYGINGIPRFILIDPAGNIVSADAPRPSNPKLIELFDSLDI
jgi:thiol-disulfide isomerase/thioredoxin